MHLFKKHYMILIIMCLMMYIACYIMCMLILDILIYMHYSMLLINPHLICVSLPNNYLFHYSSTIKKARNRLNVGQILFTIYLLSKRPGRGAWDFINGGGLLIRGGDYHFNILRFRNPQHIGCVFET